MMRVRTRHWPAWLRPSAGWWRRRERAERALLLLPYLLGAVLLLVLPGLLTFALAFTYFDGITPPIWWGLRNFLNFYIDPLERIAVGNSLYFTALAVPLRVLGALGLALCCAGCAAGWGSTAPPSSCPPSSPTSLTLWSGFGSSTRSMAR